jgi:hypothetical protein
MRHLVWLMCFSVGCKAVDAAPKELDDLIHFFWNEFENEDEAILAEALVNLNKAVDGRTFEDVMDGTLSPLSDGDMKVVELKGMKPAKAQGLFIANVLQCNREQMLAVLTHKHQDELYDTYNSYERNFFSSRSDFLDKSADSLDWDVTYGAAILGADFTSFAFSGLRRINKIDNEASPFGDVYLARTWAPVPFEFQDNSNKTISQDYQIEVFYPRAPGEMVHVYGMWREADFGIGFSTDDEGVQRIALNNMAGWDTKTEENCLENRP